MFLPQGAQIAAVKGREGPPSVETAKVAPIAPSIPMIVMTDERTASASEIVTGENAMCPTTRPSTSATSEIVRALAARSAEMMNCSV